jgi:hypothetical protein
MKMLFSSCDRAEIRQVKKQLFQAGIRCQVHENPIAQGVFGTPTFPELRIERDRDILAAMRLLGDRLRDMTVIFPKSRGPA